jgi:hypothetical protein
MSWKSDLQAHFDHREELSLDELAAEFGVVWPEGRIALQECLGLFLQEYGIPIGLLRQDDDLRLFLHPPPTRNPIGAAFRDAAMQDKASELNYMLKKRRRSLGTPLERSPMTVGQYVAAWFGQEVQAQ